MSFLYGFCFVFPPRACLHPHLSAGKALCCLAWGPHLPQRWSLGCDEQKRCSVFLHAMYPFPTFYFPPFKNTNAFRASCCPSLWVLCPPCPSQALPPAPPQAGCAAHPTSEVPPLPCRVQIQIHPPSCPHGRGPALC